ncbi:hypothetical protein [Pseudomonas putida]|uniref:hypothetical protein n=1 Tax=Pseudomonas putida TaxID=303 RepID=UPI002DBAEC0F|nr:hypothetical protein [Pseudomonas putida]WRW01845.1 hypothetical protein VPZ82_19170 [Pseudomonas putida]
MFDRLVDSFTPNVQWIWHGGEPMLMKPEFYRKCSQYALQKHPGIKFAIQTNLLAYKSDRWKGVFEEVFEGRISTSFDPYKQYRTVKGSADTYDRLFWKVRIPHHPATQSTLIWPGIPRPSGHLFHGHPAGQSERSDAGVALLV